MGVDHARDKVKGVVTPWDEIRAASALRILPKLSAGKYQRCLSLMPDARMPVIPTCIGLVGRVLAWGGGGLMDRPAERRGT